MLRVEFTVEPFVEGRPGPHVNAAVDAVAATGLEVDFGPFGSAVQGDDETVVAAVADLIRAATAAGASRVAIQVERVESGG
ncbi:MAG: thiamine-binding protein [Nitriliruptorales bacterium]